MFVRFNIMYVKTSTPGHYLSLKLMTAKPRRVIKNISTWKALHRLVVLTPTYREPNCWFDSASSSLLKFLWMRKVKRAGIRTRKMKVNVYINAFLLAEDYAVRSTTKNLTIHML